MRIDFHFDTFIKKQSFLAEIGGAARIEAEFAWHAVRAGFAFVEAFGGVFRIEERCRGFGRQFEIQTHGIGSRGEE